MRCPGCRQENPADSPICGSCGAGLGPTCTACGASLPPAARFCWGCGRAQQAAQARPDGEGTEPGRGPEPPAAPPRPQAERRHLTVMFCDLVASSVLADRLDPEDLQQVVGAYHDTSARIVEGLGGRVAQYLGDGVLAYFSHPQAHEDDAERAVRAGLDILAELADINRRLEAEYGVRVGTRIGIHTGPVVVGSFGRGSQRDTLALGQTVNVASRLQEVAEPDSVVISDETLRLVRGLFVTEPLGARVLEGIAEPVAAHRAVQPSGVRSRLDVAGAGGLTPLVGRERDLALLEERWGEARGGRGRVVFLRGDPGIGKSRLVHALRGRLAAEEHTWLECRGSPYHTHSALHPVIELLRQGLRLRPEHAPEEQLVAVERGVRRSGLPAESVPLLADLLSLPRPAGHVASALGPEARRRRTLEVLERWLFFLAALQPTVLAFEDLHWADPSSLELLGRLMTRVESAPLLVVATLRRPFEPPWEPRPDVTYETLEPLTSAQAAAMVGGIAGRRALAPALVDEVVRTTDGVPLFIEELTKSILESDRRTDGAGSPAVRELPIPSTLQDSLAARLDRLGSAKDVAQVAAVLGREFSAPLLAAVSGVEPRALEPALARLAAAGLVHRSGEPPDAIYTFKHALVQESAYQSLLRSRRRALHERTARVLEERFPEQAEREPEALARHCERGGRTLEAISHYERAGERAAERWANAEAIAHLTRAIELLRELPAGRRRDEREAVLQVSLGARLAETRGWGSREAELAYGRARDLCERVGEAPQLFRALRGLVTFSVSHAELEAAHELCGRLLRLAETRGGPAEMLLAHQQMAILRYYMGSPATALSHYERALAIYAPPDRPALALEGEENLGVFIRIWMAWTLWILGHPDRALAVSREAIAIGREARQPFSLAYALLWTATLHVMRREREPARDLSAEAAAIADKAGFAFVQGGGRLVGAWSRLDPGREEGENDRAVQAFREALAQVATTGSQVSSPMILGVLAAACVEMGRHEDALATAEAALAISRKTHQPFWDAELLRIQGEALLGAEDAQDRAEALFRRGLELARSQGARSLELRAAVSLARLWQRQGHPGRARKLLDPVYGSFAEGFDSPDLEEARSLRDALS